MAGNRFEDHKDYLESEKKTMSQKGGRIMTAVLYDHAD